MKNLEAAGIRWHPGFYSATELEFLTNKNDLEFQREYHLSKEPIRIDLLVIKRLSDVSIRNEIGHIFKKWNVIEYKSPDDGLTIDDYFKTIGYACLYKGLGETVGLIPEEELTISIFRESYPRELFANLKSMGCRVKKYRPGIYYITGPKALFDTQIIVTGQLDKSTHHSLRILSRNAQEEDVEKFLKKAVELTEPGDKNNADAVLQVSVSANEEIYERIRRGKGVMCEALRKLFQEDFDRMLAEHDKEMSKMQADYNKEMSKMQADYNKEMNKMQADYDKEMNKIQADYDREITKLKDENENKEQETLLAAMKSLMESMKLTAEQAMSAMKIPEADRRKYMSKLQ